MLTVRPAFPADEAFLTSLLWKLADFEVPPWRTAKEIADADLPILLDALHRPQGDTVILVAEAPAGTPAGYVFVSTKADYFTHVSHAHVEVLAVMPDAEGRGVGGALLEAAERWAAARGHHRTSGLPHDAGEARPRTQLIRRLGDLREPGKGALGGCLDRGRLTADLPNQRCCTNPSACVTSA